MNLLLLPFIIFGLLGAVALLTDIWDFGLENFKKLLTKLR